MADFVTKRGVVAWQRHAAENPLKTGEGVIGRGGASFEDVDPVLAGDENGVATICGLARLPEVALKVRKRHLHRLIRLSD
jgi:hypothetical protein